MAKKRVEKVKGEGGTGQVALCPLGRLTPPLSLHFQEGRCCCLSQALAEGLARDRGALPSSIACR